MSNTTDLEQEARTWLAQWSGCVAAANIETAKAMFDPSVIGYGTKANEARGLQNLVDNQWSHIWPNISDFAFDHAAAEVWISSDGSQAVLGTAWDSLGYRADGTSFPRGGRATVVLRRDGDRWLGLHTHVSLEPIDPGTHLA